MTNFNFNNIFDMCSKASRFRKTQDFNFETVYILNRYRFVKFVRSTKRGFNFLDLKTNKYVCKKRHLYSKDFINKGIPDKSLTSIRRVEVPVWMTISEINNPRDFFIALYTLKKYTQCYSQEN